MQKVRDLAGVRGGVDERERLADAVERDLTIARVHLRLCEEAQERRALALFGLGCESLCDLFADDGPIAALGRGLSSQTVEHEALGGGERFVTEEIVETLAEPSREDLQRTNGW